ncbi:GH92 family glycosyl hydrolase [Georgenia sp. MJ206]|uniref:GH92 family glycosyl hydrolase n=1 Tax=Georgenia wangjunii TaxID=3117730 RepID=UPI002F26BE76
MTLPTSAPRRRTGRTIAVSLIGALAGTMGLAAMALPAAAAETEFASSFESGDAQPAVSQSFGGDPVNVTGDRFGAGSLLGYVTGVTGTGSSPAAEAPPNAADGNPSSKWLTFAETGTLTYELSEPVSITGYALTSANDAPERDPRDFTVEGSTDGTTWVELDAQTGQAWQVGSENNRGVTKGYELAGRSAEYAYYRLDVTANNGTNIVQLAEFDLIDADRGVMISPMITEVTSGPTSSHTAKTGVGFTGTRSLQYVGQVLEDGDASATNELFDVDVEIAADSQLTYKIFPVLDAALTYAATHVAVDLVLDDGTRLSATDATDAYGFGADARSQGTGKILWPDQWNSVTVDLGALAGRTVDKVLLSYDQPGAPAGTPVLGYLDDVTIEAAEPRDTSDGLISYVDTRRGTNSTGGFSRGNNLPASAWPNGFNFITPMTNPDTTSTVYSYQRDNNAQNLPGLAGIGFSHQPSIWMGDRNQLAVLPAEGADPTSTIADRRLAFRHENEVARPDRYAVEFENGIAAEVTPTDHGAVYRFTFTGDAGSVLVDQGVGTSGLDVSADGAVTGWVDGGSGWPGRTRMFVSGQFDATPTAAGTTPRGNRASARYAAFDTSEDATVELRIASSFISLDQATKNLDLELTGRTFEDVHVDVMAAWNDRLSVITDVEGATDAQLVNLYSGLYRLNLYPNSQFENTGTAADPVYRYASPVSPTTGSASATETNAEIVDGKVYVNNGFWDTYRTAWPAYAMLYPDLTEELVDGFVQQYRDGGWVARWSSPGYADLMTGTSSDVSFAEAYLAGALSNDLALEAYDAAVKNATVLPASNAVGRKGLERSIFLGFTEATTHESASWGLEGFINDFGIAQMAEALAEDPATPQERVQQLREEAEYFDARAGHFAEMYNPEAGVFTARNADGTWPEGADFDKKAWGGAFTEASAWTFAFHAPHDVDGLAALYGGRRELLDELDAFLTTQEKADYSGIHEAREARDVRLGMLGMSNQVAHHIPYVLAEAGDPARAQALIRDIQQRLFAGSDIGQGYPGDEDNGEFSSWYIFSALGFYPLQVGSGDYTIGSPLFDSVTLNLGDTPLTINAPGASDGLVYVAGLEHDGVALTDTTIDGDLIRDGGTLTFTMSETPTSWGAKDLDEELSAPEALVDATKPGFGTLTAADGTAVGALTDDNMRSAVTFAGESAALTWSSASGPVFVHQYTLTSTTGEGVSDPASWTLEGSVDGLTWTELDARSGEQFPHSTQTRPFSVPDGTAAYSHYRLTVAAGEGNLGLAEVELFAAPAEAGDLTVLAADDQSVRVGTELTGQVGTVVGGDFSAGDSVVVDYGDGAGPQDAVLSANGLGGWTVRAPHTFTRAGVYSAVVTATDSAGTVATATSQVSAFRDDTFVGQFNNICIGDLDLTAGSCDGQGHTFFRDKLAASGFVQGETIPVPGTDLTFDLPDVAPGEPDNVTGEGQTFRVDLGEGATQISLIGTATELNKQVEGTLTFSDGTEQALPIEFGDWVGAAGTPLFGNIRVGLSEGRLSGVSPEGSVKNSAIFATAPLTLAVDEDGAPKTVVSITLPAEEGTLRAQGRTHTFAIASDGDRAAVEALAVSAAEVGTQTSGAAFEAPLATVTGGGDGVTAVVNWGDGSPVSAVDVVDGVVVAGHTYAAAGTYEVWVTADDGSRSAATSLEITVEDPAPTGPEISVVADTRCVVGRVVETVRVTNEGTTPVAATITSPYGTRTVTLEAGRATSVAFSTRATSVAAGEVSVTASTEGVEATTTVSATYDARTC